MCRHEIVVIFDQKVVCDHFCAKRRPALKGGIGFLAKGRRASCRKETAGAWTIGGALSAVRVAFLDELREHFSENPAC